MPNFNIYIPNRYVELLEQEQQEEESLGLAAKRLLLDLLDRKIASNKPSDINLRPIEQRLEALEHKLDEVSKTRVSDQPSDSLVNVEELEMRVEMLEETLLSSDSPPIEQRLEVIEQRLDEVSNTSNNTGNVTDREQRLEALEQRLEYLSKTLPREDYVEYVSARVADFEKALEQLSDVIRDELQLRSSLTIDDDEDNEPEETKPQSPPKRGRPPKKGF